MSVTTVNPATGQTLPDVVKKTSAETVKEVCAKARQAQKKWRGTSFRERAACCMKVKAFLAKNKERAAKIISETNGKTTADAVGTEVLPCLMAVDWYAANAEKILKPRSIPNGHVLFLNKTNTLEYKPCGLVGIISPWNYPFAIPFGEVIMGLMAGNAIILKVATQSVLVGEFIKECMDAGGFPEGLFAHVVLGGSESSRLMLENKVDKLFFTGSVGVGKELMKAAAETLTPLSLELGGNDPAIVLEDADLERATNGILWAGFQNAGQSCGGVERVYVASKVYDEFVSLMKVKTEALTHGDPSSADIGAISTKGQLQTVEDHVNDALSKGAKIVAQSKPKGDVSKGLFYPATLMTGTDMSMKLIQDETFGPVVPIMKFETVEEAVALANDSDLALTSSVWTENAKLGREIAGKLETGMTTLNDHLYTHGCAETPWGGWKLSGLGRTHGALGLHEMCNAKAINNELLPGKVAPRNIYWFPAQGNTEGMLNVISFAAPASIGQFLGSLSGLASFAGPKMLTTWTVDSSVQKSNRLTWALAQCTKFAVVLGLPVGAAYFYLQSQS